MTEDSGFLDGIGYDSGPGREEEADRQASSDRLAATLIRRTAMRHDQQCRSSCRHRNHQRDEYHFHLLLDILGLGDDQAVPEDYDDERPLAWHSVSKSEIAWMSGKHV